MNRITAAAALAAFGIFSAIAQSAPPKLTTVRLASGFAQPVFVAAAPGDDQHLFVVEKNSGAIRVVDLATGNVLLHDYLNVFPLISTISERGLIGLAFHPNYVNNGYAYVCYTNLAGSVVLARYTRSATNPLIVDPSTATILLTEPKPFLQHNSGMLQFGLDGYLYMSIGDGGGGYDPNNYAQRLDNLKGKILRLDVDGGVPYAIPPTNPFVGVPGALGEIFAYGMRNPWRFSIDPATGNMFIGDVGQEQREELDFIAAGTSGQNFGWRSIEGDVCTNQPGCDCDPTHSAAPFHVYTHATGGASITGGFVYRGCAMPELRGTYFFADYVRAQIWSLRYDGTTLTGLADRTAELDPAGSLDIKKVASFGLDAHGELLVLDYSDGELFRVVPQVPLDVDCNANTVPDGCEIAANPALDGNGDGAIDLCVPGLTVQNLFLGKVASFRFSGAQPAETVYFLVGTSGLAPMSYCLVPNLCISLTFPFFLMAALPADPLGAATLPVYVPPSLGVPTFQVQAVVYRGQAGEASLLSNVIAPTALTTAP